MKRALTKLPQRAPGEPGITGRRAQVPVIELWSEQLLREAGAWAGSL